MLSLIDEIRKIPLFRLIVPFILGILFQISIQTKFEYFDLILIIISLFIVLVYLFHKTIKSYYIRWVFGILISLLFFVFGIFITQSNKLRFSEYQTKLTGNGIIIGQIYKTPKSTDKTVKLPLELEYIKSNNIFTELNTKVLLYIPIDSASIKLTSGDRIISKVRFSEIRKLGNPNEFDFKKYLENQLIAKQGFIKTNEWKLLKQQASSLKQIAEKCRRYLISLYVKNGIAGDELAVISALTLGYKNFIDENLSHAYSSSGGMHVLAVSGLHTGIIFGLLAFLLKPIRRKKYGRFIAAIILIFFLWFYALLTGLSPSVVRSATMFSFISLGTLFLRNTNTYNIIAASAFFMLLLNPYIITEVGFQLSYLAVLGIIYFQPKIYSILTLKTKFAKYIWGLTSVSLAAQIATTPISLFYFHQFPTYFFITNLVIIPIAGILIYMAIFFFTISFIPIIKTVIALFLKSIVRFLNIIVFYIEQLPGSTITNIEISNFGVMLLYISVIFLILYINSKQIKYLQLTLGIIITFLVIININKINHLKNQEFIVYNSPRASLYSFQNGKQSVCITNSKSSEKPPNLLKYYTFDKIINLQSANQQILLNKNCILNSPYLVINNKTFLISNPPYPPNILSDNKLDIDYAIITKNNGFKLSRLTQFYNIKNIIIDATVKDYVKGKIINQAKEKNINIYDISENGAFYLKL